MTDAETQQRFVCLRSQGWSFARIPDQLHLSKRTRIKWSRTFQFDVQNLRTIELESVKEKLRYSHLLSPTGISAFEF